MREENYFSRVREEAERRLVGGVLALELTHGEIEDLVTTCPKGAVKGLHYSDTWNAIAEAHKKGKTVDLVSVFDELVAMQSSVDAAMLAQMMIQASTLQAVFHWAGKLAEINRRESIQFALISAASDMRAAEIDVDARLAEVRTMIDSTETTDTIPSLSDLMDSILADVESGEGARPIPTPWANLNAVLKGGVAPGELVVLAARPGMGKTALAGCWAVEVARNVGPVLFISCEVKDKTLGSRMLAREGRIDNRAFREGLGNSQSLLPKMRKAAAELSALPLQIVDSSCRIVSPAMVRKLARKIKGGPSLVVVDYLQLMYPDSKHDSREREIADMSRAMKRLSVELNCPVLLLSQLNRKVEETNREPQLSDLRESGAVEQDADIVIMLHADKRDAQGKDVPLKALVRKGRSSGTGAADLLFEKAFSDFRVNDGYRPDYSRSEVFTF